MKKTRSGYLDFALLVLNMAIIRFLLPVLPVPLSIKPVADIIVTVIFVGLPILGIYRAMSENPDAKTALFFVLGGVAIQGVSIALDLKIFRGSGIGSAIVEPFKTIGLQIWCIGLGALLASLVKEKNILLPIGIFLIFFDIFLVLTPIGITQKLIQAAPQILQQGGLSIPKTSTAMPTTGKAEISGIIGPADLVFLGMFFLAMFRFGMQPYRTLRVMVPTLLAYLLFVLVTGQALPALVPIGLVTLIVNRNEFNLNKDELQSTVVLTLLILGGVIYGATRPRPVRVRPSSPTSQPVPSPSEPSQSSSKPLSMPGKVVPNQRL